MVYSVVVRALIFQAVNVSSHDTIGHLGQNTRSTKRLRATGISPIKGLTGGMSLAAAVISEYNEEKYEGIIREVWY